MFTDWDLYQERSMIKWIFKKVGVSITDAYILLDPIIGPEELTIVVNAPDKSRKQIGLNLSELLKCLVKLYNQIDVEPKVKVSFDSLFKNGKEGGRIHDLLHGLIIQEKLLKVEDITCLSSLSSGQKKALYQIGKNYKKVNSYNFEKSLFYFGNILELFPLDLQFFIIKAVRWDIFTATRDGNKEIVEYWFQKESPKDLLNLRSRRNENLMHEAIKSGSMELIDFLFPHIRKNFDIYDYLSQEDTAGLDCMMLSSGCGIEAEFRKRIPSEFNIEDYLDNILPHIRTYRSLMDIPCTIRTYHEGKKTTICIDNFNRYIATETFWDSSVPVRKIQVMCRELLLFENTLGHESGKLCVPMFGCPYSWDIIFFTDTVDPKITVKLQGASYDIPYKDDVIMVSYDCGWKLYRINTQILSKYHYLKSGMHANQIMTFRHGQISPWFI